jgi:hypothetical protein
MVVVLQVADFVRDYVLNAMHRYLHQIDVQRDSARGAAASPPSAHKPNHQQRLRDTVARRYGVALFHVTAQGLMGPFSIPCLHGFPNTLSIGLVFNPNPEKTSQKLRWLLETVFDFETILPTQINEGFATDVSLWSW